MIEYDVKCDECGVEHDEASDCGECPRCKQHVGLDEGADMPSHRMCHPCASAALDEALLDLARYDTDMKSCYRRHGEVLAQLASVTAERDALLLKLSGGQQ